MEALTFTAVAVILYIVADVLLDRFERWLGRRLRFRSLVFFGILASLAVAVFTALQHSQVGL